MLGLRKTVEISCWELVPYIGDKKGTKKNSHPNLRDIFSRVRSFTESGGHNTQKEKEGMSPIARIDWVAAPRCRSEAVLLTPQTKFSRKIFQVGLAAPFGECRHNYLTTCGRHIIRSSTRASPLPPIGAGSSLMRRNGEWLCAG